MVISFIVLQGRVILDELILSIPLPGKAHFHCTLPSSYTLPYTPYGKHWMFCVLGNTLVQEGNIERGITNYTSLTII